MTYEEYTRLCTGEPIAEIDFPALLACGEEDVSAFTGGASERADLTEEQKRYVERALVRQIDHLSLFGTEEAPGTFRLGDVSVEGMRPARVCARAAALLSRAGLAHAGVAVGRWRA